LFGPAFLKVPLATGAFLANFLGADFENLLGAFFGSAFLNAGRFADFESLFSSSTRQVEVPGRESDL
jgi:hypothetical protein